MTTMSEIKTRAIFRLLDEVLAGAKTCRVQDHDYILGCPTGSINQGRVTMGDRFAMLVHEAVTPDDFYPAE
jgi:hypothetical protein